MQNWQGTSLSKQEFFKQQEDIPVEISPPEPNLVPLQDFKAIAGIHPTLGKCLTAVGYAQPTPVQKHGIPLVLSGKDVMACAQTGSGKTAFYLIPPINRMLNEGHQSYQEQPARPPVLIMGPTRELCVQIFEEAQKFTKGANLYAAVVYGGTEMKESFRQLKNGADILIATPGRLQDLCDRNAVSMRSVQQLVLDEADRMLDMGFEPQITKIVQKTGMPKSRQTVMTSATFPPEVQHLAQEFMRSYSFLAVGRVGGTVKSNVQRLAWVEDTEKDNFLFGLLMHQSVLGLTLVFVNTKQQAMDLERFLHGCGFSCTSIHGDRTQQEREAALHNFKSSKCPILIATDVAARGLDIPNVALVIQYDLATSAEDYVHRVGRTARIGNKGISIGMVNNRQKGVAAELCSILEDSGATPPPFLVGMAISTGNYEPGGANGGPTYGGQDVRKSMKKGFQTAEERDKARRFAGFATNAYGQGDSEKAAEIAQSIGPAMPGSYQGAAAKGKGGKGKGGKGGKGDKGDRGGKGKHDGGYNTSFDQNANYSAMGQAYGTPMPQYGSDAAYSYGSNQYGY